MGEQVVKRKSCEDKSRSGRPSVLTNYVRNVIKKPKYKCNNSTRQIAKNFNITISTFEHNGLEIDQQRVESFQLKEDTTVKDGAY